MAKMKRIKAPRPDGTIPEPTDFSKKRPKKNKAAGLRITDKIKLEPRQEEFCQQYIGAANLNARVAAELAGYQNGEYGYQLLQKRNVALRIAQLKRKRNRRLQVTQDRILKELANIAYSNLGDYFQDFGGRSLRIKSKDELTEWQLKAIKEISETERQFGKLSSSTTFTFKLHDKLRAISLAMAHLGIDKGEGGEKKSAEDLVREMRDAAMEMEGTMPGGGAKLEDGEEIATLEELEEELDEQ